MQPEEGKWKRKEAFNDDEDGEKYYGAENDDNDDDDNFDIVGMEEFFADYSHLTAVGTNANNNIISTTHINNTVKDLPITIRAISSSNSAFNRVISSTSANALHSYSAKATAMRINNSWTVRSP